MVENLSSSSSGNIILEVSLVVPLVFSFLFIFSLYTALWFSRIILQQSLYEGLLCIAEQRTERFCKTQLGAKILKTLPWGKIQKLQLSQEPYFFQGELIWSLAQKKVVLRQRILKKELHKKIRDF